MAKHALLSASGAYQWLNCTKSARACENIAKTSSSYADEGTAAHELCELTTRYKLSEIDTTEFTEKLAAFMHYNKYYSEEMREHALAYAKQICDKYKEAKEFCSDSIIELEASGLDFSKWVPEGHGTGDCIIVADDTLEIIDFKYGKGHKVFAENNPQMRLYALGAYVRYGDFYDIKNIKMTIVQPRVRQEPDTDEISLNELLDWAENYVRPRAKLAFDGQGEFAPGDETCKFCAVKAKCKARADFNLSLFDDAPETYLLTIDEIAEILKKAKDITKWVKDLENAVRAELFAGNAVNGWKLAEGKSNRVFSNDAEVEKTLLDNGYSIEKIYEIELLSPAKMQKLTGTKDFNKLLKKYVIKPQGKPTVAPEGDKRAAITPGNLVLDAFDETDDDE